MKKPVITIDWRGVDGNVFAVMAKARAAIISEVRRPGFQTGKSSEELLQARRKAEAQADQMTREVMTAHSYDEAIESIRGYVTIREEV